MILELLAAAGIQVALERALELIADYRQRDPLERLLALLHQEFGVRAELGLTDFDSWEEDESLAAALRTVLAGSEGAVEEDALADLIRPHLDDVIEAQCEGCGQQAPFLDRAGDPYLEPHHTRRVSDGGPDDPRWVIALCPTCHTRVHYGADGDAYNDGLQAKLASLEAGVA